MSAGDVLTIFLRLILHTSIFSTFRIVGSHAATNALVKSAPVNSSMTLISTRNVTLRPFEYFRFNISDAVNTHSMAPFEVRSSAWFRYNAALTQCFGYASPDSVQLSLGVPVHVVMVLLDFVGNDLNATNNTHATSTSGQKQIVTFWILFDLAPTQLLPAIRIFHTASNSSSINSTTSEMELALAMDYQFELNTDMALHSNASLSFRMTAAIAGWTLPSWLHFTNNTFTVRTSNISKALLNDSVVGKTLIPFPFGSANQYTTPQNDIQAFVALSLESQGMKSFIFNAR